STCALFAHPLFPTRRSSDLQHGVYPSGTGLGHHPHGGPSLADPGQRGFQHRGEDVGVEAIVLGDDDDVEAHSSSSSEVVPDSAAMSSNQPSLMRSERSS